ncbi:hypothetical protein LCGC14_1813700 [marine sediment metagenome]|uniref:Uncharacterized protein n=1 Tax=marine sediment metagenome TaxID=412755 RepID=A0A0F9GKT8_9ZZZZ
MARLTPEEYADKQARNLKNSLQDIRDGIGRVTTAPGTAAVAQQDKMRTKVLESIDSGLWASKTRAVSLQEWQQAALQKGVDRIPAGIDAAHDKQVQMASRLLPIVDAAAQKARQMPKVTLQDSIARMTSFVTDMSRAKGRI